MGSMRYLLRRKGVAEKVMPRVPGWVPLAGWFSKMAETRAGQHPVGLFALMPVALAIDFADFLDEAVPVVGSVVMFGVETAFLMGVTGRPTASLGMAAFDIIPGLDIVPFATIATIRAIREHYQDRPAEAGARTTPGGQTIPNGPVIDV